MFCVLPLLIPFVAGTASAQSTPDEVAPDSVAEVPVRPPPPPPPPVDPDAEPPPPPEPSYRFDGVAPPVRSSRALTFELNVRARKMSIPKSILDTWYFDDDAPGWAWLDGRPKVHGMGLGLEWVVRDENTNGIFYVEWADSMMGAGYWDDVESPPDHLDGEFIRPSPGMGLLAFGANYAYEAHLIRAGHTGGQLGMSLLVGGGLGAGLLLGPLDRWGPGEDGSPAYIRYLAGEPPDGDKRIPRVFPMVDLNASLRFTFGERWVVRVEGGLHSLLYYGMTTGVMF